MPPVPPRRPRPLLLSLTWLPATLLIVAAVASYTYGAAVLVRGYGALIEKGGIYFVGPSVWPDTTSIGAHRNAPGPPDAETLARTTSQRWMPFRPLQLDIPSAPATVYVIPLWVFALALATPPFLLTRKAWRRRHLAPDHCPTCGYDLRATPDRCPECGTIPAA